MLQDTRQSDKHSKIQDIQFLRGVAISMVLFQHLSLGRTLFDMLPVNLSMPFYTGVEIFFVISGYVVTRSLLRDEHVDAIKFLWRRAFRLFPAMVAFIGLSFLVLSFATVTPASEFRDSQLVGLPKFIGDAAATLTGTLLGREPLYYFGAMWSLSVEFQFYLGFAILAAIASILPAPKFLLTGCAILALAACLLFRFWPSNIAVLIHLTGWRFDFLLVGVILALIPIRHKVGPIVGIAAFVIGICLAAFGPEPLVQPLNATSMTIMMACFATVVVAASQGAFYSRTAAYRAMVWFGDRSYSAYLIHFPLMALLWVIVAKWFDWIFYIGMMPYSLIQATFTIITVCTVADMMYRKVELPFIAIGQAVYRRAIASD